MEYHVRQAERGAGIALRARGEVDAVRLRTALVADLARLGLPESQALIGVVDRLERPATGKLMRFVSLAATAAVEKPGLPAPPR